MIRFFVLMLLLFPMPASAGTVVVDLRLPHPFIAAPEGSGDVSIAVEDVRTAQVAGKSLRGDELVLADNSALALYRFVADDLNQAGYVVVDTPSARHFLIRLEAVDYTVDKGLFKSRVDVRATLSIHYRDGTVARSHTLKSHVWQEVALNPSSEERGRVIGQALAEAIREIYRQDAVRAILARSSVE